MSKLIKNYEVKNHMSKFKLVLALLVVLLFMSIGMVSACDEKYAVPGDTFNLAAPSAPEGVKYTYLWTVVDSNGLTLTSIVNSDTQNAQFAIPTTDTTSSYTVTLSVGSGTSTSGQIQGCILTNCLLIHVQLTNTCGISGTTPVCQTDSAEVYTYTGNAVISGDHPTAYLKWIVDTTNIVADHDATGHYSVDWTNFWTKPGHDVAQTHIVTVEVHSMKSNALLCSFNYPVKVLPSPVTTITPT